MFGISPCDIIFITACLILWLVQSVISQCSEAHQQACSLSYLQLKQINTQLSPPAKAIPDYNETMLNQVCKIYSTYRDCSQPFLSACNQDTVIELQTYDVTLGLICGNMSKEYLRHRSCFQRLQKTHSICKDKELYAMRRVDTSRNAFSYMLCSSAKEYVLCIYSSTALGCSIQAADLLFQLLNQSVRSVFRSNLHTCDIRHPMDVITIYTTTPSSTAHSTQPEVTTLSKRERPGSFVKTSNSASSYTSKHFVIGLICISTISFLVTTVNELHWNM